MSTVIEHQEAIRIIRSNLVLALEDWDNPTILVTSARAGEGKTATCADIGLSLSLANFKVVMVDLDIRHPDLHNRLGAHNRFGASDVLLEKLPLPDALQFVPTSDPGSKSQGRGLFMVAAGSEVANPTELLSSPRTGKMLRALAHQADIVLIDTPPVLPVADTLVIGRSATAALMVVEANRTPIGAVHKTKEALIRAQIKVLGVILNKGRGGAMGYGYGYGYGHTGSGDDSEDDQMTTAGTA